MTYDVTEQLSVRENLKKSEERFKQLADSLNDQVVHIAELLPHAIAYISPSYERIWKKSVASLIANPNSFLERVHPDDKYILENFRSLQDQGIESSCEYRLLFEDGSIRYIKDTVYPLKDANGIAYRSTGIAEDITESKLYEMRLRASEAKFREMINAIPHMVWSTLPDGYHDFYNKRWYEFTGVAEGTTDGEGWCEMFHPDDMPTSQVRWRQSLKTGEPYETEYRLKHHSGNYRWTLGRALPIFNDAGEIIRWMGTCTDINDLKILRQSLEETKNNLVVAKEAAEAASKTKSAFLANMSHEIRTPLGAILGFGELLKDRELSADKRDQYLDTIKRNGNALTRIIDDILDLAKVEAGKLEVEEIEFSVIELLSEVVDLFKAVTQRKGVALSFAFDNSVPVKILSDPSRIRQILFNIVGNAVKFTDRGEVRIAVDSKPLENSVIQLLITVKDTGRGLTPEQRIRLFQPFTQADNTTTRQFGGTGLGLVLSKRLSEALGGTVKLLESDIGVGCTFQINLLAKKVSVISSRHLNLRGNPKDSLMSEVSFPLAGLKILVVDDSEDNQFLVRHILQNSGASVILAGNGVEALENTSANYFDIVLMDIQMPFMDGHQAMEALISRGYTRPVIALTAHAMVEERLKTKASGFTGHLTKPLNVGELIATIIDLTGKTPQKL